MYSFSVCLWIKSNASPGVGTPFSYAVPGQSNELVLIEWGNNPMEILINDKVTENCLSWIKSVSHISQLCRASLWLHACIILCRMCGATYRWCNSRKKLYLLLG